MTQPTLPSEFGDWRAEHSAVRTSVGLLDRPDLGVVRITGKDRVAFLHNLVSSDVKKLPLGRGQLGYLLTVTGHVFAELTTLAVGEELLVLVPWGLAGRVAEHLERFHIMEKVAIQDRSAELGVFGLHGPAAGDLLNQALAVDVLRPEPFQVAELNFGGERILAVASRFGGVDGFELIAPVATAEPLRAKLLAVGDEFGLRRVGAVAAEALRVEAGIPRAPNELSESVLGLELNRPAAFAHGKCYPGQEVVARIEARGHVNKSLLGLVVEPSESGNAAGSAEIGVGDEVFLGDRRVATLTSVVESPSLGRRVALGFVRREASAAGTAVVIRHGESRLAAVVRPLPLV